MRCLGVAEALELTGSNTELVQVVGTVGSLQPIATAQKAEATGQTPFAATNASNQAFNFTLLDRQLKNRQITVRSSSALPPSLREGCDVFVFII